MDTTRARLAQLEDLGIQVIAEGSDLEVTFDEDTPAEKIEPILDELIVHKSEFLAVLVINGEADPRIVDGHTVRRIVWQTEKAIVFEDEEGRCWRQLHAYDETWPVIVEMRKVP